MIRFEFNNIMIGIYKIGFDLSLKEPIGNDNYKIRNTYRILYDLEENCLIHIVDSNNKDVNLSLNDFEHCMKGLNIILNKLKGEN